MIEGEIILEHMDASATSKDGGSRKPHSGTTLHLLPEAVWAQHRDLDEYLPETYEQEGFVHCTNGEEHLLATANRYYRDDPRPFLLLEFDLEQLEVPVQFADDEQRYPHLYGPIARNAVLAVRRVQRDERGNFLAIGDLIE